MPDVKHSTNQKLCLLSEAVNSNLSRRFQPAIYVSKIVRLSFPMHNWSLLLRYARLSLKHDFKVNTRFVAQKNITL